MIALQTADARLQRMDRPQLLALRRAINRDIDRLKALPFVDTLAISTRLDNMIAGVDTFPLAMEMRPQPDAEAPVAADGNAWTRFWREAWSDLKQLVRVQQMDKPEMPLLTPSQAFFLRENLKLRLIGARLSLLARDAASYKADLEGRARLAEPLLRHAQQQRRARRRRPAQPARGGGEHTERRTSPARWRRRARCGSRASARPVDVKALAWIIVLFAVAVGVTLFARYNTGYVLLVIPPWRIEFSLNVLLVALAVAFAAGYAIVRATSATMRLPRQVREYRLARRREQARTSLAGGAARVFRRAASGARKRRPPRRSSPGEQPQLAAVLAARAAHELRAWDRRDQYLERAGGADPDEDVIRVVTEAELLLGAAAPRGSAGAAESAAAQAHRGAEARAESAAAGAQLGARGRARRRAREARRIRRHPGGAGAALRARRRPEAQGARHARAGGSLAQGVPQEDRTNRRVAAAAAQCFIALGGCARAHGIIEEALAAEWDTELVGLYAECDGGDTVARIERAEGWLKQHPEDAVLLLTLGKLCAQLELWGKAQSYLDASVAVESTWSAHLALARLHERLGNVEAARKCYRESLDLALAQLRAVTGGRRRMPL